MPWPFTTLLGIVPYAGNIAGLVWVTYLLLVTASTAVHGIGRKKAWVVFGSLCVVLSLINLGAEMAGRRMAARMESWDSGLKSRKFMDKYFDNVATSRTTGYLQVLVVDDLFIGNRPIGGFAWFPHWVDPTGRKHGITVEYPHDKDVLSHELGHMFSLKHTFNRYMNLDRGLLCNRGYKPKGAPRGYCNSCKGTVTEKDGVRRCSSPVNLVDYCRGPGYFLNACQKRRAANQRRAYMTKNGETKYRRLKGLR